MKVGWVHEDPGYVGGAELTMAEFRKAAPCEVVDGTEADVVVVGNCYTDPPKLDGQRVIQYHHDMRHHPVAANLDIFCSPMQRERYDSWDNISPLVPPAIDASRFKSSQNGSRSGTLALGAWQNPGKGQVLLLEWSKANEPVDVYGEGPFTPRGKTLNRMGLVPYEKVPETLRAYERFLHLPTVPEPFGRSVVEAWYAGCEVVTNDLVGAKYWIEQAPEKLETAAEDFWNVVSP